MRLDKFLSEALGIPRSESRKRITKGQVTVDGTVCKKADALPGCSPLPCSRIIGQEQNRTPSGTRSGRAACSAVLRRSTMVRMFNRRNHAISPSDSPDNPSAR